jgi:hypothetical protein
MRMPHIDRTSATAITLVFVGIAMIVLALYFVPHPGQPGYVTHVDEFQGDTIPEEAVRHDYGNLSAAGKDAFREAQQSADGKTVVYGTRPSDFVYSDVSPLYVVTYNGTLYEVRTKSQNNVLHFREISFGVLLVAGIGMIVIGAWKGYKAV